MNYVKQKKNIYSLLTDNSLANEFAQLSQNRFISASFPEMTHFMVSKNWAYTHIFKELVTLISDCVGKQLKS